jgi:hypothetical protein
VHHEVQEKGRFEVFEDYHLRVGEIIEDTKPPEGQVVQDHRIEETEVGPAKMLVLIEARRWPDVVKAESAADLATGLGYAPWDGLLSWDIFEGVLTPGDLVLILSFRDEPAANSFKAKVKLLGDARLRTIRVIRDYGMRDRREAPQYYPDVTSADVDRTKEDGKL